MALISEINAKKFSDYQLASNRHISEINKNYLKEKEHLSAKLQIEFSASLKKLVHEKSVLESALRQLREDYAKMEEKLSAKTNQVKANLANFWREQSALKLKLKQKSDFITSLAKTSMPKLNVFKRSLDALLSGDDDSLTQKNKKSNEENHLPVLNDISKQNTTSTNCKNLIQVNSAAKNFKKCKITASGSLNLTDEERWVIQNLPPPSLLFPFDKWFMCAFMWEMGLFE